MSDKPTLEEVRGVLADVLQLGERAKKLTASTPLLGSIPEFDSMAVVSVLTALEEHFGFAVHDDEISAEVFETVGTLTAFVDQKLAS
jgi:acyl carrier protein